ncbi:PspC domain-containing protein [Aquihabitans sp. McL0605]|uniref:PspC domain-containing protein n=1 Tax=Aquihabitans sp. McL0605 TaxID=3415671 RepID=UPI003CF575C1
MSSTPGPSGAPPPAPFLSSPRRRRFAFGLDWSPGPPWRSRDDRLLAGLAGGVAEWTGVSSVITRAVFAFVIVGSVIGPVVYVLVAVILPVSDRSVAPEDRPIRLPQGTALSRAGMALAVAIGATVVLQALGMWFGSDLGLPAALAAAGLSLVWARTDQERREFWRSRLVRLPGDAPAAAPDRLPIPVPSRWRLLLGGALFLIGTVWVLDATDPGSVYPVLTAIAMTVGGVVLVAGPWLSALWRDLADERAERIRSDERAEVAAQLHDSVLQTLALIQRHPETTRHVAQLARQQERSLRAWLFEIEGTGDGEALDGSFGDRLRSTAHEVEDRFDLPVELVLVGDLPPGACDGRIDAVVAAAREAMANAASHSGEALVSVFAEVSPKAVSVFVRDRGVGFDPAAVAPDRQGVRESIVARMARNGGRATVTSAPGEGTEIALELDR